MVQLRLTSHVILSTLLIAIQARSQDTIASRDVGATCLRIKAAISNSSSVYWPDSTEYDQDIAHYISSSTSLATCSVEPGTPEDVGVTLRILGSTRTPFAVKGGGHAANPGFSSTTGVQIAMSRFSAIDYHSESQTVEIGAGLIWDDVYAALEPVNMTVLGGRDSGVGVAGLTLGGGYSWLTNQYGLTIDSIESYELVLPNGTVTTVTNSTNPDLYFGLRGGFNNFGIITKFTLRTFPQGPIWGGFLIYPEDQIDNLTTAVAKFSAEVTDPKAQMEFAYMYNTGTMIGAVELFYDAPSPPDGIYDDFLAIPSIRGNVSTRSLLSLVQATSGTLANGTRGLYHTVSFLDHPVSVLQALVNETKFWGERLNSSSASIISYSGEPFLPSIFSHGSPSAYPPSRARGLCPLAIDYFWELPSSDELMVESVMSSAEQLTQAAIDAGQDVGDAALYGNYAVTGTPLSRIYGSNLPRLKNLKAHYDPDNVMGLAGGWKF